MRAAVGPIRGTFDFAVEFTELRTPERAALLARGQMPGSTVEMKSAMELSALDAQRTSMRWSSDVVISGMIASVGARLLQGTAERMTQQVFACIKSKLEAPVAAAGS